jgi:hypothetical protein
MEENTTQQPAQPAQPELTVTDLSNLRSIVDVAVRRGAFGASEIAGVGQVFDKLNNFLNAVDVASKQNTPPEA